MLFFRCLDQVIAEIRMSNSNKRFGALPRRPARELGHAVFRDDIRGLGPRCRNDIAVSEARQYPRMDGALAVRERRRQGQEGLAVTALVSARNEIELAACAAYLARPC